MKVLSYQPFSVYDNGGGSRILRRLYEGHEHEVISLVLTQTKRTQSKGAIKELYVYTQPVYRRWMRSYLRTLATWLQQALFKNNTAKKISKEIAKLDFDVLHVIDHGFFSWPPIEKVSLANKHLWVSFHDFYSTSGSTFRNAKMLWTHSDRRFVISREMGEKYQSLFGKKQYEIITDGLYEGEICKNRNKASLSLIVYFAGLLHIDYYPLFETLADALDKLSKEIQIELLLRGTQRLGFLTNRKFQITYKPFIIDNEELRDELNTADILYLPIKFSNPSFFKYSLSTKMVGYLSAPGTILYHGPADSAANHLLMQYQAACSCTTLHAEDVIDAIVLAQNANALYSGNAKKLAGEKFSLSKIQRQFWMT